MWPNCGVYCDLQSRSGQVCVSQGSASTDGSKMLPCLKSTRAVVDRACTFWRGRGSFRRGDYFGWVAAKFAIE